ncbi:MAG: hypothetical protein JSV89_01180 [Spirochaetaceae bacterium]|nr:MAG: hypothetical protein JSV89_01180 [Spirochaetaceae bacterium]
MRKAFCLILNNHCGAIYTAILLVGGLLATQSCVSREPSQYVEPTAARPAITERLLGTWISSEPGYPMKIVMTADGRDELYISILDPVPLYWSEYKIDDEWTDQKDIEWLALTYYCVEPFCENRQIESYAIATVSGDGTRMVIGWKEGSRPKQTEKADYTQLFYREGTELADAVEDLPSESAYVAIDQSESSYLIFYGIPNEKALETLKAGIETDVDVDILSWSEFVPMSSEIVDAFVIHDDYEHPYLVPGILALLRTYTQMEIGLTWNNGIAITRGDFIYAEKYYESFKNDPEEYNRNKIPYDITHHPMEHFRGLLGW